VNDLKLLDIIERDGAANLGQTLLRLASLAAAAHQFESARLTMPTAGQGDAKDGYPMQARHAPAVHKEVNP
jgi:hypothetical protein